MNTINPYSPARVIVIDDHPLFRRGVVELLNGSDLFEMIADFSSAMQLKEYLINTTPDLLLLDLQMPDMSGLEALKQIKPFYKNLKIVILTASDDNQQLLESIRYGADGYLMKDSEPEEILSHLSRVLEGQISMNDAVVDALAHTLRNSLEPEAEIQVEKDAIDGMTEREQQTLNLIAQGMNNKLIARELGISDGTVKVYVKNLLRKLDLHSRLELAAWVHSNSD
jgi:two-component system nitrate/nitrite response regulator NarL